VRLLAPPKVRKPDFNALKDPNIARKFDNVISACMQAEHADLDNAHERLLRLNRATQKAMATLPARKQPPLRKRNVSNRTKELYATRSNQFDKLTPEERREISREIKKSCRKDYREYIRSVVDQIAAADLVGDTRAISRLTKSISTHPKAKNYMPSKTLDGSPITSMSDRLTAWQSFLGQKFACVDPDGTTYAPGIDEIRPGDDTITWEEFEECVEALKTGRAPGADETPIEAYVASPSTKQELYELVCLIYHTEVVPTELVRVLFLMLYKKGARDDYANYRAIGLLCHSYKVLSVLVLRKMQPVIEARLPDSQAGFRKARGCRDNVLILKHLIQEVLKAGEEVVLTFVDYTAAFDSLHHNYLDTAMGKFSGLHCCERSCAYP